MPAVAAALWCQGGAVGLLAFTADPQAGHVGIIVGIVTGCEGGVWVCFVVLGLVIALVVVLVVVLIVVLAVVVVAVMVLTRGLGIVFVVPLVTVG